MATTADHDDGVVPAHSFKYIATLQEKYHGDNPVLIRNETDKIKLFSNYYFQLMESRLWGFLRCEKGKQLTIKNE